MTHDDHLQHCAAMQRAVTELPAWFDEHFSVYASPVRATVWVRLPGKSAATSSALAMLTRARPEDGGRWFFTGGDKVAIKSDVGFETLEAALGCLLLS